MASEKRAAAGGDALRGAGDLRRARRGGEHADRPGRPRSRRGSPPTWTSTRSTWSGPTPDTVVDLEVAAADNLKRVLRPTPVNWTREPDLSRMLAFLETKTVWHPVGV